MRAPRNVASIALLLAVATTARAAAEVSAAREPTPGLFIRTDIYGGNEPRALIVRAQLQQRYTYHRDPDSVLFDRAHIQGGLVADISPAFSLFGVNVEWLPLQILRLRLQYGLVLYHGFLGLLAFDSPSEDWSERTRRERDDTELALGHNLRLTAELRLRVWRFVVVSQSETNLFFFQQRKPYVFEQFYSLLISREDGIFLNRAALLFEFLTGREAGGGGETLRIGVFHSVRLAFDAGTKSQQAGLVFMWEPTQRWWIFDRPSVVLLFGFHLEDRWVEGRPTILGGVGSSFDLTTVP